MGYYHCSSCDGYFITDYRKLPEDGCPYCKDSHRLNEIGKGTYVDCLDAKYYDYLFNEIDEEKRHQAFLRYADMVHEAWENKHRGME